MPEPQRHSTLLAISLGLATVVGLLGGLIGGFVGYRLSPAVAIPGNGSVVELTEEEVDRQIVELVEEESATINTVERVTPAVVSIVVRVRAGDMTYEERSYYDDDYYYGTPENSDPDQYLEVAGGTGFFLTEDGLIVTNKHVVSDERANLLIVTNAGEELPATVVDTDPFFDLAFLRVEGSGFPVVKLGDSDRIRIGQTVIAIGNALAQYRNTVTKGVVSGINRHVDTYDFEQGSDVIEAAIQTDAAINPGNSGGPLINILGEVIGVNTAISSEGEGVGFAIPINEVSAILDDVRAVGHIVRPWLGVRFVMLTEEIAAEEGLAMEQGALLVEGEFFGETAVVENSPADEAGLQEGDVILSVNGTELTLEQSLSSVVRKFSPGDRVTLRVARGAETLSLEIVLAEFEE